MKLFFFIMQILAYFFCMIGTGDYLWIIHVSDLIHQEKVFIIAVYIFAFIILGSTYIAIK